MRVEGDYKMTWDFFQRYDESWIWRRVDRHEVTESKRNFAALEECMEDAARHGYTKAAKTTARRAPPTDRNSYGRY